MSSPPGYEDEKGSAYLTEPPSNSSRSKFLCLPNFRDAAKSPGTLHTMSLPTSTNPRANAPEALLPEFSRDEENAPLLSSTHQQQQLNPGARISPSDTGDDDDDDERPGQPPQVTLRVPLVALLRLLIVSFAIAGIAQRRRMFYTPYFLAQMFCALLVWHLVCLVCWGLWAIHKLAKGSGSLVAVSITFGKRRTFHFSTGSADGCGWKKPSRAWRRTAKFLLWMAEFAMFMAIFVLAIKGNHWRPNPRIPYSAHMPYHWILT